MLSLRIATFVLAMSLSYVPVDLSGQVGKQAVPVIDIGGIGGDCLLGGSIDGRWLKAEEMAKRMNGGDKYRVFDLNGEWKNVTVGKPESRGSPCAETFFVDLPGEIQDNIPEGSRYIGVAGKWNPLPRTPRVETETQEYRNAIAGLLRRKGIRRPQVNITKVVRVDLEGDGVDEVIINATRVNRFENGRITPDAGAGDYSIVMLRKLINGKVRTFILEEEYHPKRKQFTAPSEYNISAVVDLNGDGVMEIIVAGGYYEGAWNTVYSFQRNKAVRVLECGCGA